MAMVKSSGKGWDRFAIRAEIHRRGGTLTKIAKANKLSDATCRMALLKSCPAGERAIAKFLKLPAHALWPDRYDARGRRRPSRISEIIRLEERVK